MANLTLVASKADLPAGTGGDSAPTAPSVPGPSVPSRRGSLKFCPRPCLHRSHY